MYKSYVFRLYPNKEQKELINKTIGCSRFVYNYYLDKKKKLYEENKENYQEEIKVVIITIRQRNK